MKKTILIVCANGASSNLLAEKIRKNLTAEENWLVESKPLSELPYTVAKYDCILIAPQISFEENNILELTEPYSDIQVMQISPKDFAMQNADAIIAMIKGEKQHAEEEGRHLSERTDRIRDLLLNISNLLSREKHLVAIRNSLMKLVPLMMLGGLSLFLAVPPVVSGPVQIGFLQTFLEGWQNLADRYHDWLFLPYQMTMGIISLYVLIGLSYEFAQLKKMNHIQSVFASLLVYLSVSDCMDLQNMTIRSEAFSSTFMFSAIAVTLVTVELLDLVKKIPVRMKLDRTDSVPEVMKSVNFIFPLLVVYILMGLANGLIVMAGGHTMVEMIYLVFQPIRDIGVSLPSILLINLMMTTLWFFGLHGNAILGAFTVPMTTTAMAANAEALMAGKTMPYVFAGFVTSVFGNWMTYNAFLVTILLWGKSRRARSTAKVAILPGIFNINEPMIFGLPTVLNIYTYIPLVICNAINTIAYDVCARLQLVGRFYVMPPFTLPGPIHALIGTGDIRTMILWLILFVVNVLIARPFMKYYDMSLVKTEEENLDEI